MRIALLAVVVLVAGGCGTRYQEMGFAGGVEAQQVTADTYRIVARGNAYTDTSTIKDYALLKAAETTKAAGRSHFVVVGAEDASRRSIRTTPGTATTTFSGDMAFTSVSPGSAHFEVKPGQDAYIRLLPGPAPGAYSADEVISFVGSRVKRPG